MKYRAIIEKYWEDTKVAFNAFADIFGKEWKECIVNLIKMIDNCDIEDIQSPIEKAKSLIYFNFYT